MVVDDEAPARQRLRRLLAPFEADGSVRVVAEAENGPQALRILSGSDAGNANASRGEHVDVLFMDIRMPELDGFETIERIDPDARPLVIFTTAYDEYAIRAFEANAIDYLLKPVSDERCAEALRRAERALDTPAAVAARNDRLSRLLDWIDGQPGATTDEPRQVATFLKQVSIHYRDKILIVPIERLLSAEVGDGVTRLYVSDEHNPSATPRPHIVPYSLDQLEANLDPSVFMRVHRSAIVQVAAIQEMIQWFSGRYKLVLAGGHEVIASRDRSRLLRERLLL